MYTNSQLSIPSLCYHGHTTCPTLSLQRWWLFWNPAFLERSLLFKPEKDPRLRVNSGWKQSDNESLNMEQCDPRALTLSFQGSRGHPPLSRRRENFPLVKLPGSRVKICRHWHLGCPSKKYWVSIQSPYDKVYHPTTPPNKTISFFSVALKYTVLCCT